MERPLVSVIMGVFNQRDDKVLLQAVNSILNQTYKNLEFIIWDDGSDEEAAKLLQKIAGLDERITVAGREENRGLAYSLNECIRIARGKYIARMDSDDISMPERIEKQVDFLEKNLEYSWCGTNIEMFDENGVWGSRNYPDKPQMKDYYRYSPFVHPSVVFRAEVFDSNKYLSTEETLRCEDYEIFMSLAQKGLKGYNLQEKLFCYRETRESYKKRKPIYRINEAKTRYRNYKKMGKLFPFGWIYVLRPIVAILIPSQLLTMIKRKEGAYNMFIENRRDVKDISKVEVRYIERQGISETAQTLQYGYRKAT